MRRAGMLSAATITTALEARSETFTALLVGYATARYFWHQYGRQWDIADWGCAFEKLPALLAVHLLAWRSDRTNPNDQAQPAVACLWQEVDAG